MQKIISKRQQLAVQARWFIAGLMIASILVALTAIFGLSEWAEITPWHHAVQHVLLLTAGIGIGGSAIAGLRRTKGDSDES